MHVFLHIWRGKVLIKYNSKCNGLSIALITRGAADTHSWQALQQTSSLACTVQRQGNLPTVQLDCVKSCLHPRHPQARIKQQHSVIPFDFEGGHNISQPHELYGTPFVCCTVGVEWTAVLNRRQEKACVLADETSILAAEYCLMPGLRWHMAQYSFRHSIVAERQLR